MMKIIDLYQFQSQKIGTKNEKGKCIIEYPGKIFCKYLKDKKVIVSDGKSLVVKNKSNNQYYFYPLNKTTLNFLLDKNFLIHQIEKGKEKIIDDKYINYSLIKDEITLNIFFDISSFHFVGWQTEDLYQNLIITYISKIKTNELINQKLFILPINNQF